MGARENLERMLALADERLARGVVVNTPEEIQAQELARHPDADKVRWREKSGQFEPVRNRRLYRRKPNPSPPPRQENPAQAPNPKPKRQPRETRWAKLKAQVLRERDSVCEHCQKPTLSPYLSRKHHRTWGKERPEDVEVLCPTCWKAKHEPRHGAAEDELSAEYRQIIG